jgi:hypothetical protein
MNASRENRMQNGTHPDVSRLNANDVNDIFTVVHHWNFNTFSGLLFMNLKRFRSGSKVSVF